MKIFKTLPIIIALSISSVANAQLLYKTEVDNYSDEDVKVIKALTKDIKERDFTNYKNAACDFYNLEIGKEVIMEYCKDVMDDTLEVINFKIDFQTKYEKEKILVPKVKTMISLHYLYHILFDRVTKNMRYTDFVILQNSKPISTEEEKEKVMKALRDFVETDAMKPTKIEFENFQRIYKELKEMKQEIINKEKMIEVSLKEMYVDKKSYIYTNQMHEQIFNTSEYEEKIKKYEFEMDVLLKNEKNLEMFYRFIQGEKINYVIKQLQDTKNAVLKMEECKFIKDYGIFSRQGLRALTCKD